MKKLYIYGMAAVLGLGLAMQSCGDDEGLTKEDVEEAVKASNALSAEEVAAIISENTLTEDQIKKLIEDNKLTEEEIEAAIIETRKTKIDSAYHEVGVDTLDEYVYNFKGGLTAYIKVEGATDENIGDVFEYFKNTEVTGILDLTDCKLENITSTIKYSDYKIAGLVFPKGLKSIPEYFAEYNTNIKSVTFNEGIERIAEGAFYESGLESVALPEGLKYVDDYAFDYLPTLGTYNLPSTLETIGQYSFYETTEDSITIPANIKTIGDGAFEDCSKLEAVTFLGTSTDGLSITYDCFNECPSDMKIYVKSEEYGQYLKGINSSWNVYCGDKEITE